VSPLSIVRRKLPHDPFRAIGQELARASYAFLFGQAGADNFVSQQTSFKYFFHTGAGNPDQRNGWHLRCACTPRDTNAGFAFD
jgi:hypothetical protein